MSEPMLADVARDQAHDIALLIANELEALASRVKRLANGFSSTNDGEQAKLAARLVSEVVQGQASIGSRLSDVVRAASQADVASLS